MSKTGRNFGINLKEVIDRFICRGGSRGGGVPGAPLKLEKNMTFLIVIFHTKYPKIYTPPYARHNFFKCDPPNFKSWIRPWFGQYNFVIFENKRLPGACNRSPGSKLLSITTQLHCGGHLGGRVWLPDTILEEDHPMTSIKFWF